MVGGGLGGLRAAESLRASGYAGAITVVGDEPHLPYNRPPLSKEALRGGERCVCELTDTLDAAQSRLSFHLKTLKDAGMVTDRREGRWVYYTLAPEALAMVQAALDELATPTTPRRREWWSCCS